MRPALPSLLLALLAVPVAAASDDRCRIHAGPDDLVAEDRDLVVPEGRHAESAVALRGDVVVKRGASVKSAVAIAGSVVVEDGGVVREDAAALGGDVRVEKGGRVGKDAVALGGQVRARGEVKGSVVGLAIQLAGSSWGREILDGIHAEGCVLDGGAAR